MSLSVSLQLGAAVSFSAKSWEQLAYTKSVVCFTALSEGGTKDCEGDYQISAVLHALSSP